MNNGFIYFIQVLFVAGIAAGSEVLSLENKLQWLNVARYSIYILTISGVGEACKLVHGLFVLREPVAGLVRAAAAARAYALIYAASAAALLLAEQAVFTPDFVYVLLGYLVVKYPDMSEPSERASGEASRAGDSAGASKTSVNYGVGMACSYFEGYLVHILPSDGHKFVGFEENISALEDSEGIHFPVKKMFIVITKSLYSPPNLKEFNRGTDVPHLEAFNILPEVKKSVAGTKDRTYHNTAYKICRPGGVPVCLTVECATPLHTLYKVICNRRLYDELAEIDIEEVKTDFCNTLKSILNKSLECRGKCELIFYDHDDPTQNLAEILLNKIRELCPKFEEEILARRAQNIINEDQE